MTAVPAEGVDPSPMSREWWWDLACEIASWLRQEGNVPPPMHLQGPIMQPGEVGRIATPYVDYSRLYGGDGSYRHTNPFVFGPIEFVAGVWSAAFLMNQHKEKAQAEQNAKVQWRDQQNAVVYVTSQRVITALPDRTLDFALSRVSGFYPDLDNWAVMLEFTGEAAPLRLTGPAVPALALWIAYGLLGSSWVNDPRFDRLG